MKIPDLNLVEECISFGKKVALFTFLIGSAILIGYYFYSNSSIIFISLFFMVVAFLINTYTFIKLTSFAFSNSSERKKIIGILLLLLLNIPIAYAYIKIGLEIYSSPYSNF